MSSTTEESLIQRLPLIKEPCFKYFCNQDHAYCFSQLKKQSFGITKIIDNIQDLIGKDQLQELTFVIFCVLNLSVNDKDDPPKIPYIDLNNLKLAREEYLTYSFYDKEKLNINEFIDKISIEYTGHNFDDKDKEPEYDSIKHTLNFFDDVLGQLVKDVDIAFNRIKKDHEIIPNFMKFIQTIESINALSIIGTLEFIDQAKNIFLTYMNCSLYKDKKLNLDSSEKVINYTNIITKIKLAVQIHEQSIYLSDRSNGMKSVGYRKDTPIGTGHGIPSQGYKLKSIDDSKLNPVSPKVEILPKTTSPLSLPLPAPNTVESSPSPPGKLSSSKEVKKSETFHDYTKKTDGGLTFYIGKDRLKKSKIDDGELAKVLDETVDPKKTYYIFNGIESDTISGLQSEIEKYRKSKPVEYDLSKLSVKQKRDAIEARSRSASPLKPGTKKIQDLDNEIRNIIGGSKYKKELIQEYKNLKKAYKQSK